MIRALRAQVYTGFSLMKVSTLKALSPADGRYADKVNGLRNIFSEYGLIRFRVLVEVRWLQALSDEKAISEIGPLSPVLKDVLNSIIDDFSLDDAERDMILDRIEAEKKKGRVSVTRFKGLGEMNPAQLRETTMAPETRRLVQLTVTGKDKADQTLDMLLAKKRAADRRDWLQEKGNLAEV